MNCDEFVHDPTPTAAFFEKQLTAEGPFSRVTVSPNAKLIALFADSGNVLVYTADFQQKLLEFSSKSKIPPRQLAW